MALKTPITEILCPLVFVSQLGQPLLSFVLVSCTSFHDLISCVSLQAQQKAYIASYLTLCNLLTYFIHCLLHLIQFNVLLSFVPVTGLTSLCSVTEVSSLTSASRSAESFLPLVLAALTPLSSAVLSVKGDS